MEIGVIGLGKMGYGLACNLKDKNYTVFGYDLSDENVNKTKAYDIAAFTAIDKFANSFKNRKIIFLLIPAGSVVDKVIESLGEFLNQGDVVIDAGNSNYKDSIRRYEQLKEKGVSFLDCGTSGGPSGARNGACTMIGGDKETYDELEKVFTDISVKDGALYTGKAGSGHFVKMVHNGIEYGMMQSIAEGYEIMHESDFDIDLAKVSKLYNNGSVIRSWLIELVQKALEEDPKLDALKGVMHASGEAKWTVETALDYEIPAPVITLSLMMRNRSLRDDTYSGKIVAALRNQFGGHDIVSK